MIDPNKLFVEIANGNQEALNFITLWSSFVHLLDDIVDGETKPDVETMVKLCNIELRLITSKFYDTYRAAVAPLQILAGDNYINSERLRREASTRKYGEFISHSGNDMLRFVALITGGENHLNYISEQLRLLTIQEHPDHSYL